MVFIYLQALSRGMIQAREKGDVNMLSSLGNNQPTGESKGLISSLPIVGDVKRMSNSIPIVGDISKAGEQTMQSLP